MPEGKPSWPQRVPPAFLSCSGCGRPLVPLVEQDGRLAILLHQPEGEILIQAAQITCGCGTVRKFYGSLLSGFRLGITDEAGE